MGLGQSQVTNSLVVFLRPNFSYRYQYAEGVDEIGAKNVFGTLERKIAYTMTTNNLSLKSHVLIMAAVCNRAGHIYFHPVVCSSSFFLFFPRLISAVRDWMSAILPHVVWP